MRSTSNLGSFPSVTFETVPMLLGVNDASFGLNIGLLKEIRQTTIQIKREHQQAYDASFRQPASLHVFSD